MLRPIIVVAVILAGAGAQPQSLVTAQGTPSRTCEAEYEGRRVKTSSGGFWLVSGQRQMCDDGKWIHDPAFGPQDPLDAKRKPCLDPMKQEFASGLLRETPTGGFERCLDGKWVTKD
jgi:hypothetical protein